SDVPGDRPADVASGPTLSDTSSPVDALAVLEDHGVTVPGAVAAHLRRSTAPPRRPEGPVVVVGSGTIAAEAAAAEARRRGIDAVVSSTGMTGEARQVGR
ncbi:MAG: DUF4147 domain-containing protein, partial [Actinobacteria bacterium]|nr:DUF4147 domain-containing protein [Actinomycetota bacterium]NIS31192.1 DUF4147 domain-containing protein [Actinomycetota bacterium]NIU19228.1 DUF4147 domain-containing protein [Actinomycetota bacterium]NIU66335.1 DUF4147 domain-containing protein [Actinomycetota bacterium]NIV55716.1 DUF4147 domain-containing protein [Actinomycetota bacterium]